jgi:hypothetical protein
MARAAAAGVSRDAPGVAEAAVEDLPKLHSRHGTARLSGMAVAGSTPAHHLSSISERLMTHPPKPVLRLAFLGMTLAAAGCAVGAPERASSIQNANGISDDISAMRMTQSDSLKIPDPNLPTTYPHSYQLPQD